MRHIICYTKALLMVIFFSLAAGRPAYAGSDIQRAGDVLTFVLPAAAGGLVLGNKDKAGALQFAESAALALGATFLLKYTVQEKRPNGQDNLSLPSAHTSVSFTSAEFIRKRYGWQFGIPAYAAASFVAYSRVESRDHFAHDVIAGAAIERVIAG